MGMESHLAIGGGLGVSLITVLKPGEHPLINTMKREIVRRLWEIVGGNSLMNVGINTKFYVGQLI